MPTNKEFLAKKVELDDKQDKLTAGDNITINQDTNTISANYPDVIGATSSTAGTRGLVPSPAAGDEDKFLKGDGTWGVVSAGSASLAGLTDVDLNSPTDGQALVYDAANQEWVNGEAGNADYVELTQAEYDALTPEQKTNGTLYFITDGEGGGGGSGSGISGLDWNNKVTVTTSVIPPQGNITYTPPKSGVLIISGYGNNISISAVVSTSSSENFYAPLVHQSWTSSEIIVNANEELTITNGSSAQTMGGFEVYFVPFLGGGSSSSSINYSTEEQKTGQKWIDGKPIYQKTVRFQNVISKNSWAQYSFGLVDADNIIKVEFNRIRTDNGIDWSVNYNNSGSYFSAYWTVRGLTLYWDYGNASSVDVITTIQYTKITD